MVLKDETEDGVMYHIVYEDDTDDTLEEEEYDDAVNLYQRLEIV